MREAGQEARLDLEAGAMPTVEHALDRDLDAGVGVGRAVHGARRPCRHRLADDVAPDPRAKRKVGLRRNLARHRASLGDGCGGGQRRRTLARSSPPWPETPLPQAASRFASTAARRCSARGCPRSSSVGTAPARSVRAARASRRAISSCDTDDGQWFVEKPDFGSPVFMDGRPVERVLVDRPLELRLADPDRGPVLEVAPAELDEIAVETTDWGTAAGGRPATPVATPTGTGSFLLSAAGLRIGREPSSDVVVDDLLASRHHAEIRHLGDERYEVVDLDSHNGTFVNGRRITRVALEQRDVIMVGRNSYRLNGRRLEEDVDTGEVAFAAAGLTVRLAGGAVLLDG